MQAAFYTRQGPAEEVLSFAERPNADPSPDAVAHQAVEMGAVSGNFVLDVVADSAHT